jgi:predicted helicase
MSFQKILDKYRKIAFSERDKGDRFERLMQSYLKTDPRYAFLFKNVWLWNEFPGKLDLGGNDTGIDLVALTHEGDYWAIQCKCYQEDSTIDKPAVDSFLSTSSREFKNEQMQTTRFAQRLWIDTSGKSWGSNAEEAIKNQNPPVSRLRLFDLIEAPVDWDKLEEGIHGELARTPKKSLRQHQKDALEKTHEHYKTGDRGKLIMACGTGKTFTALRIAENETQGNGLVLFLVPSIALLGQSLREWSADANEPINAICICSDPEITKKRTKNEDADTFSVVDLALPASTDTEFILHQFEQIKAKALPGMTVVFSTYQSIEVIARAQRAWMKSGFPEFDLIICDEAHRTTGVSLAGEDESAFTKVHDAEFLKAKKRLYMTATPRLYNDETKSKAAQAEAVLCSMDDKSLYGEEMYRIGFGEAVEHDLLTDYKVLILTLNDKDVPPAVQRMISNGDTEIHTDDLSKLIGTVNALSKQFLGDLGITKEADPALMRRAVAFCANIATSKKIASTYNSATEAYLGSLPTEKKEQMVSIEARHIDGTMAAPQRDEMLSWLKAETTDNECRIITNVRVLSEGVDVPSLDAVLFLSARNSQVDVVQSVGRVMRKSPGKKYGYIIIPVVVPADVEADKALDDNERYKVVWTVLNALRAHDDRFNATVNKIELNRKKPENILVGRPEYSFDEYGNAIALRDDSVEATTSKEINRQLAIQFEQLQNVVFARMVQKVGDRRYWEQWAKDVAVIAERQIERITYLIKEKEDQRVAFEAFLLGLQKNINPSITQAQAVEMLAQHIITQPIFDALFEGYSFIKNNAVSMSMQHMINALESGSNLAEQDETLQKFYESVRKRAEGIDNAEGKQRIIIELYDKFFKAAFPKMVEQLGIVYTPVEVVDFIIHSVNDVLKQEFGRTLSDENIHILDPFTGTGTFITRLLQSGLIAPKYLARKYRHELYANEIVLLAYYIAAVNIENAFHDQLADTLFEKGDKDRRELAYEPFEGIVLTDTFQLSETDGSDKLFSEMFPRNSERVARQKKAPLRVIIGNPPYSVGQKSANDNAQNQKYEKLDGRIANTYAKATDATNKNSLYDSYIKAFRWSTDRLDPKHGGIIAFVSNGAWLDGNAQDGFRKTLEKEFTSIWVFNTRGNARTSGELRQKEAGNVFGSGSRTPITITVLVKNPAIKAKKATIHYHDIGDYHNREEKLSIIRKFKTVSNPQMAWSTLQPNEHGDWISQRNDAFGSFILMGDKNDKTNKATFFLPMYSNGVKTNRDSWVYNFSKNNVVKNTALTIDFYNQQLFLYQKELEKKTDLQVENFINTDPSKISWSRALREDIARNRRYTHDPSNITKSFYRPFCKLHLYFHREIINDVALIPRLFPATELKNIVICVPGIGITKDFSCIITDTLPDLELIGKSQCFPLYYYEERPKSSPTLFDTAAEGEYIRRDGISDFILARARKQYSAKNISKEDIFYYVYGFLHSPEYRAVFANDLKKMLPRIPLVDDVRDFWSFSNAGRKLAELHINYESVSAAPGVVVLIDRIPQKEISKGLTGAELEGINYKVEKMRFPKKGQKDTINYNHQITIENIPEKAYEYVVNGKSAIEWIMERYAITIHKESGIKNDPNDWAAEVGNPRYILDLLLSIINVSVQTVDIVASLPKLEFGSTSSETGIINEHDLVTAKTSMNDIAAGTLGTVVHVYKNGEAFEVEFEKKDGSITVETVLLNQIEKKQ